jgi:hypothetical protein
MVDDDPTACNLEVVTVHEDSNRLAYTIMPHYDGFDGTIKINTHKNVPPTALVTILMPEIGHLMGLCHTRDRLSAMYYLIDKSLTVNGARLERADIAEVGKMHALRQHPLLIAGGVR